MSQRQSNFGYSNGPYYEEDDRQDDYDDSSDLLSASQYGSLGAQRYSVAQGMPSRPSEMSDFHRIRQTVERMQQRSSPGGSPGGSIGSNSGSSRVLPVPPEIPIITVSEDQPYQAPYLPTIDSGEPLQFDDFYAPSHDQPANHPASIQSRRTSNSFAPPRPLSTVYEGSIESTSAATPVDSHFSDRPLPTVRPQPAALPQARPLPQEFRTPPRPNLHQRKGASPSPQYVDHFRYDAEAAYASGTRFSTPRSRSRSPGAGDGSFVNEPNSHYTGTTGYERDLGDDDESEYDDEDEDEDDYDDEKVDELLSQKPAARYLPSSQMPEPLPTFHYGLPPIGRVERRHKVKRKVKLTNGNLIIDLNVPPKLVLPRRGDPEVMKTRYTAVTCDPDDFEKSGFFLRQNEYNRKTELCICITMYNEDEVLFCRTMYGVMRNISHLCTRKNSQTWGADAWQKVVVCIIADGRKKVHPRVLDCLTLLGIYQPGGHMKNMINNNAVTAHLFEYTTTFALDPEMRFRYPDKGIMPTQVIFCMKEKNQQKINSHRWFFNAFGRVLSPNVCVLLDVGTRPGNKSIYHLWKTFDLNSNVAGACGEIAAYKGQYWAGLLNPLVAAQNFEYKISNILDKPTESMFGYISVLPGAFSAYRYIALQNDKTGRGPLASYFKGEAIHGRDADIFTSNMYLAEDRILCFELVAKANSNWVLRYVKNAVGETDVPDALPEFISQRRRWLNGSFFAATYAIVHLPQVLSSGHSFARKFMLFIQTIYNAVNLIASWFAIGNFFLFFVILTSSLEAKDFGIQWIRYLNSVVQYCMASIVIACFLFAMGNKPRAVHWKYKLITALLALLMVYAITAAVFCVIQAARIGGTQYQVMLFSIIITYGSYAFSSCIALDPYHMVTSFLQYMLLSPMYINVLNIYAFANLDDISWGTKQDTTVEADLGAVFQNFQSQVDVEVFAEDADANALYEEATHNLKHRKPVIRDEKMTEAEKQQAAKEYYAGVRTNVLLAWVVSNGLLLAGILGGGQTTQTFTQGSMSAAKAYLVFVLCFVGLTSIIRLLGSTSYFVVRLFTG